MKMLILQKFLLWSLLGLPIFSSTCRLHAQRGPSPVRVDAVKIEELERRQHVTGTLNARYQSSVSAREEGRIEHLPIEVGQRVKAGELLMQIATDRIKTQIETLIAQLATAQAQTAVGQAELDKQVREYERMKNMTDRNAMAQRDLDLAEAEMKIARSNLELQQTAIKVLETQLELLRIRVREMTVVAPFDGVIVRKFTEAGEWIKAGEPIVRLISTDPIEAWLEIPERYARDIAYLQGPLSLKIAEHNEVLQSSSLRILPEVDRRVRTISLIAVLPNERHYLAPGMSVTGELPVGDKSPRLTVHKDALLRDARGFYLYKVVAEGDAQQVARIDVQVAFETPSRIVVESADLQAQELTVIEGNERLRDKAPVRLLNDPPQLRLVHSGVTTEKP